MYCAVKIILITSYSFDNANFLKKYFKTFSDDVEFSVMLISLNNSISKNFV